MINLTNKFIYYFIYFFQHQSKLCFQSIQLKPNQWSEVLASYLITPHSYQNRSQKLEIKRTKQLNPKQIIINH